MKDDGKDHEKMMKDFRSRFFISLVISIPILVLSPTIQGWFGYEIGFPLDDLVLFALALAIFLVGGYPFLKGLKDEVGKRSPGMMTLIGLAITVAFVYSASVTFGLQGRVFYWELATLVDVMLVGHWIEMKATMGASRALKELADLIPDKAHKRTDDGGTADVPPYQLEKGDIILVRPGEKVPIDGVIHEGKSHLDESLVTGESEPVGRGVGDKVVGGSLNGDGSLEIEVSTRADDTYLHQVMDMVRTAQRKRSRTEKFADRAAKWLTFTAVLAGSATFIAWLIFTRDIAFSVERMATVMVITCPHALGLAIPLVVAVSTSRSARNGLLIRNRTPFEGARNISKVVFDKTGTLTEGSFDVGVVEVYDEDMTERELLSIMATIEQGSEHPIADAVLRRADERGAEKKKARNIKNIKGQGIEGELGNRTYRITGPGYLEKRNIEIPETEVFGNTRTVVHLSKGNEVLGSLGLSDRPREGAREAVSELKEMDIECWLITGDSRASAVSVSGELGIDNLMAEVLPHEKKDKISELKKDGSKVAMVGDGVNDAPALAASDLGIAIGSGTDIAAETADIVLVESDPRDVVKVFRFGKATFSKMVQNLIWATAYNVFAIPLAAGVLFWAGIMISPAVGAGLMSLSTVMVAINAQLLSLKMG